MNYGKKGIRKQQKALNSKAKKWGRKFVLSLVELFLAALIGLAFCGVAAGWGIYKGILASTPQIRLSDVMPSGEATIVYDCEGNEIDRYVSINSNRIQISDMNLITKHLGEAFVAIEDKRFYQHNGIDLYGIGRAGYRFLLSMGKIKEGASTIPQQLLKNTVFTTWTEENDNMIKMMKRKIQEQYLALEVSKYYSKDDILLRYMNAINLGQNTLGVESASQRYFGKSCGELTISECATIAAITQNPSGNNPISHPENNSKRRQECLDMMLELEFISQAEYDIAVADTAAVYERISQYDASYRANTTTTSGSYFSDAVFEQVRDDLVNIAGYSESMAETLLYSGGLRIESTLDPTIQAIADEEFANPENYPENVNWYLNYALTVFGEEENYNFSRENMMSWFKANLDRNFNLIFNSQDAANEAVVTYRTHVLSELGIADDEKNYVESISMTPQPQAALVIEDQRTGYVVAIVGGRGIKEGRRTLNRATDSVRSPGSTFKVLAAFAPALDSAGQTLATVYNDAPFNYANGRPVNNWYKGYRGINPIRTGIKESLNIIAVKTITVITPQLGYNYLVNFGFTTLTDGISINGEILSDVNQSLALGGLTNGVTTYELNAAYAAIANMGTYVEPKLYSRVTNTDGDVLLDNTHPNSKQVIKETTAFLLTDAMVDVATIGTGSRANFNRNMAIAGKTGTSTGAVSGTTDNRDVWFAGFTPYYTCTVWAGYDNNVGLSASGSNREDLIAINLWRKVMERVHENLPNEKFITPPGIVRAQICTQSGKLPIPGVCPGECIKSELFAEGTVPTESCTVHYMGVICNYDRLPASPNCPFPVEGMVTLPLQEDPSLAAGSMTVAGNPDEVQQPQSDHCQHDDAFFANPDYETIITIQQWEITQRAIENEMNAANPEGEGQ